MRKLNVDFSEADKPKKQKRLDVVAQWSSPVGWWRVTTEGDCEGRTTNDLGQHYGHVVDIALQLADKSSWKLTFQKLSDCSVQDEIKRVATKREVNVSFSGGPFDSQYPNIADFIKWLDTDGILVTKSNLYGAISIEAPKTKG